MSKTCCEKCITDWSDKLCTCPCHLLKEAEKEWSSPEIELKTRGTLEPKPEAWEEEFDDITAGNTTFEWKGGLLRKQMKQFIRQTLQAEKDRIRGEVLAEIKGVVEYELKGCPECGEEHLKVINFKLEDLNK